MRKMLHLLMAITLVISTTGTSYAAFSSDGITVPPYEASVTIGGSPSVVTAFSAALKNIADDTGAASVTWDAGSIVVGTTKWLSAQQYIEIEGWETYADWGIQIYTDNVNGTTPAQYTGTSNPAGLVREPDGITVLPMCWRVNLALFTAGSDDLLITEKELADLSHVLLRIPGDYVDDNSFFAPWFWMLDKNTPDVDFFTPGDQAFVTGEVEYAKLVSQNLDTGEYSIQLAPDTYISIGTFDAKYYVYLGARFNGAVPGETYSTNTLTVEMFHL